MARHFKLEYKVGDEFKDISERVNSIDKFTDSGTGEVVSAKIFLDARFDNFLTGQPEGITDGTRFEQFDEFKLTVWPAKKDDEPPAADEKYSRILFLDNIAPQKNEQGTFITLDLMGREHYLQKMFFTGRYFWISFDDMVQKIIDYWNANNGDSQPEIGLSSATNIPAYTFATFEFGDNRTVYDALMDVVNRLELPVAAGGGGQPYTLTFADQSDLVLECTIKPLGQTRHTDNADWITEPLSLSNSKESMSGNVVRVKGAQGAGSMPSNISKWSSWIEEFVNIPRWETTTTYDKGVYVHFNTQIFESLTGSNTNLPVGSPTHWQSVSFADYIDDANFQYSPWTHDKAALFKNYAGGDFDGDDFSDNNSEFDGDTFTLGDINDGTTNAPSEQLDCISFPDSNLVVRDGNTAWRDWVDFRITMDKTIPKRYLYLNTNERESDIESEGTPNYRQRLYSGMRILIDIDSNSDLPDFLDNKTRDKFGVSYLNALAQYDGDEWVVLHSPSDHDECAVLSEGRVYMYNAEFETDASRPRGRLKRTNTGGGLTSGSTGWEDISKVTLGADCFHRPYSIKNVAGLLYNGPRNNEGEPDFSRLAGGIFSFTEAQQRNYFDSSAIEVEYRTTITPELLDAAARFLSQAADTIISASAVAYTTIANAFSSWVYGGGTTPVPKQFTDDELDAVYTYGKYEDMGWWITLFETPFPKSMANNITEKVGALFGGTKNSKVPLLDLQNLTSTRKGNTGYGHSESVELAETDGISFLFRFDIVGLNLQALAGNLGFRCAVYDAFSNVWVSDVALRFQGETQQINLPWSSFRLFRARSPATLKLSTNIRRFINPELNITEIFQRWAVKRIVFHYLGPYDDQGVFDPFRFETFLNTVAAISTSVPIRFIGTIDALRFTTIATAIASDKESGQKFNSDKYHLDAPQRHYPGISNISQLQKAADAELARAKFRFDNWTARVPGTIKYRPGDTVYVQDVNLIDDSAFTGVTDSDNTKKIFTRKVTYSIGDRSVGSGFITTLDLYQFRGDST